MNHIITKLFSGRPLYLKGLYSLRDNENCSSPVDCPTIFVAFGAAIRSGNWRSCTAINTPEYIFVNYIQDEPENVRYNNLTDDESLLLTKLIFEIGNTNRWDNIERLEKLISVANELLIKIDW